MTALTHKELERYQRHILLKEIGGAGQEKLLRAKVLMVGAGGIGTSLMPYLVAGGIGRLGIIDDDVITLPNLQRQILYDNQALGVKKIIKAKDRLSEQNPHCDIEIYDSKLNPNNALDIIKTYDLVVDGTDNFPTRFLINDACFFAKKPYMMIAISQWMGHISCFKAYETDEKGKNYPCYRSFLPYAPAPQKGCEEFGVMGALCGVMGAIGASEVIKEILQIGDNLVGRFLIYDALHTNMRIVRLTLDPANPLNGANPKYKNLNHHLKNQTQDFNSSL